MRYPADHKASARREIVARAALRLRGDGLAATGVRTLMADAGLTHGAFYAYFASRDALIAEAMVAATADTLARLTAIVAAAPPGKGAAAFVDGYLRAAHSHHIDKGCAGAALACDFARADAGSRQPLMAGLDKIIALLAAQLPAGGDEAQRLGRAQTVFAGLMGSLQLSRLVDGKARRDSVLAEGRAAAMLVIAQGWDSAT